jgi:hypothetical protein
VYTYPFGVLLCNSTRHSASYKTQAGLLTLITSLARSPDIIDTNHHTIHGRDDCLGVGIRGHSATKGYLYIYTYIHIYVDVHVYIRIHICIYIYTQGRPGTLYIRAWTHQLVSPSVIYTLDAPYIYTGASGYIIYMCMGVPTDLPLSESQRCKITYARGKRAPCKTHTGPAESTLRHTPALQSPL